MTGSAIVIDAIDAEVALLERTSPIAVAPFGYGLDSEGITEDGEDLDPFSPKAVAQAFARRIQTTRGSLPDDPNYGIDVRAYLNQAMTTTQLRAVAGEIRAEGAKDDRVLDASVTVTMPDLREMTIEVELVPADARTGGPFAFTLAIARGVVMLEALRA